VVNGVHHRRLRRFIARYGWRAYAVPVLAVVTVVATTTSFAQSGGGGLHVVATSVAASTGRAVPTSPAPASNQSPLQVDPPSAPTQQEALPSDALPGGVAYTQRGNGTFRVLAGRTPTIGKGKVKRYTVEIENGLVGVDPAAFARQVTAVLGDRRSWTARAGVALQRVDSGTADFHVSLTSALTVRKLCGYELRIETSCWSAAGARVVLNVARWMRGDLAYVGNLDAYRVYMINHESGHALGHSHAHACLPNGVAPVMMQQTISLRAADGRPCRPNPWPYPPGVVGSPGGEVPGS
jgi:Protein of unknown function (DUF3152)